MSRVDQIYFLKSGHLFVQSAQNWIQYDWPSMTVLSQGDGTGLVDGNHVVGTLQNGTISIDGVPVSIDLPMPEPVQRYLCAAGSRVLLLSGNSAFDKPRMPGPSLNPIPTEGTTAQIFGTFPNTGMSLWIWSVDTGDLSQLVVTSGIQELRNPVCIDSVRVVYELDGFPAYGNEPFSRLMMVDTKTRIHEDFCPNLHGRTTGLAHHTDTGRSAFLHSEIHPDYPFWFRLLLRRPDGTVQCLIPETVRLVGHAPVWSPDGQWLAVTAFEGIRVGVIRVRVPEKTGDHAPWNWIGIPDAFYRSIAVHNDGSVVAVRQRPGVPEEVVHLVEDIKPRSIIINRKAHSSSVLFHHVQWHSRNHKLEGVLAVPNGSDAHLPLIVDLHGGPVNGLTFGAHPRLEEWCRRGYCAFSPDYRGSGILGQSEMMRVFRGEEGALDDQCDDVLSGVNYLVSKGMADHDKLVLFGHSAGASLVNHILGRTQRFRAAVSWEGHANTELSYYLAWGGGGLVFTRSLYGGSPLEAPLTYRRQSATTLARHVKTPVLLLYGDDCTAPAIHWYTILREYGVDVELVFYRGEGHVMSRPDNHRDVFERCDQWFSKWLDVNEKGSSGT